MRHFSHEHIQEGNTRIERSVRHFAEHSHHSVGIIEDSEHEYSFQVLNGPSETASQKEHQAFLSELVEENEFLADLNATIVNDPAHGWHIKINLAE